MQIQRQIRESLNSPHLLDLATVASQTHTDPIIGVYDFVKRTFPYDTDVHILKNRYNLDFDNNTELLTAPWRMAVDYSKGVALSEDCDSLNALVAAMNAVLGFKVSFEIVDFSGNGQYDHLLSRVYHIDHSKWLTVDVTTDFPVFWEESYSKENNIIVEV